MNPHKKTTSKFIEEAKILHGDKYDYSLVLYSSAHKKVKLICPVHGYFEQAPHTHLKGSGCWDCAVALKGYKQRMGNEAFIKKSRLVHGDLYDYSLVDYQTNWKKVKIICSEHGVFEQIAYEHYSGGGCPKCNGYNLSREERIEKLKEIHEDFYDYSLVEYKSNKSKIKIICPSHGLFLQSYCDHLQGHGCNKCGLHKNSNELRLLKFLEKTNLLVEHQKQFDWLGRMSLDFFLPDLNIAIEYQGKQHFSPVPFFGGDETFKERCRLDEKKFKLCSINNIELLYFTYIESQVPSDYTHYVFTSEEELFKAINDRI